MSRWRHFPYNRCMSDSFQSIAFPEVQASNAETVASRLCEALTSRGIVGREPNSDCALDDEGFPPGEKFATVLDDQRSSAHLLTLETNGVVLQTEPTVYSGEEAPETTICPKCDHRFKGGEDFVELIGEWFEGEEATLECPACGKVVPLEQVETSPAWALAHVGVTFWNWPFLSEQFIADLAALVGSKAILVTGKL